MKLSLTFLAYSTVVITAMLFASCGNGAGKKNETAAPPTPAFTVFKVISKTATLQTDYPATLQGEQNIEIRPKIDGYIDKMYIDEGIAVKKGQILFRISAPQYQQDVNNAAASVNSAEADVSAAELQVKKTKSLVDQEIISHYELESAEYTLKIRRKFFLKIFQ